VSFKAILILIVLAVGGYFYMTFTGEQADALVSDIALSRDNKGGHLDINFTNPVRYLGHFPANEGDVIQVRLRPVLFGGFSENLSITNTVPAPGKAIDYDVEEVRYEGNVPGGPLIVIRFSKPMRFNIKEGEGLKSLLISYQQL